MEERCNMVVFSPIAQQPSSGIEDRLKAIQEIFRCSNQQTVIAIDLCCDEGCNCRSRSLERQRFDAAFEKTKLAETATDSYYYNYYYYYCYYYYYYYYNNIFI